MKNKSFFLYYIYKLKFGSNQTSTFQMRPILFFHPILQLDLRWPLTFVCNPRPHQQIKVPVLHVCPMKFGWNSLKYGKNMMAKCQPICYRQQKTTAGKAINVRHICQGRQQTNKKWTILKKEKANKIVISDCRIGLIHDMTNFWFLWD